MKIEGFENIFNHESSHDSKKNADLSTAMVFWDDIQSLLTILSDNAFTMPVLVCIKNGKGVFDFGNSFMAAEQTLKLIRYAYSQGNLLDSYLLLRRLFESILQYLFFVVLKENHEEKESMGDKEPSLEEMVEAVDQLMERMEFDDSSSTDMSFFHQWAVGNTLDEKAQKKRRRVIALDYYLKELEAYSTLIKTCNAKCLEPHLANIKSIMNDYTHGNALFTLVNASLPGGIKAKKEFRDRSSIAVSILLAYISLIKPALLHSSDYTDALDFGLTPAPDSQYWIAPAIQHYFDTYVQTLHPELLQFLRENNPSGMKIEVV